MIDLDDLERKLKAATQGEWACCAGGVGILSGSKWVVANDGCPFPNGADGPCIAAIHNAASDLIAELRRLRATLKELAEAEGDAPFWVNEKARAALGKDESDGKTTT